MSNILGRLYYIITGDTTALDRSLSASRKEMRALGTQLNETSRSILAFAKGTITAVLIKSLTEAASRAEEMQNRFDTVFRGINAEVEEWANTYAEATSRGRLETMEFLASQQDIRTGFGDTAEGAAEFSKAVVGITNDLASFANVPVPEAIAAVNSGLNGEFEALRRLGIGLNVAILNQMEYAESIGKTWDEMDNLERQEAILSGIVTQSGNALHQNITMWEDYDYTLGDAAVTAGSFANQMQGFTQTLTDFKAEIGDELLPIATEMLGSVTNLMRGFNDLDDAMQTTIVSAAAAGAAFFAIGGPLGIAVGAVAGLAIGLSNIKTSTERLEDATDSLSSATSEYKKIINDLSGDTSNLTEQERALLEVRADLARNKAISAMSDLAEAWNDNSKKIQKAVKAEAQAQAEFDALFLLQNEGLDGVVRKYKEFEDKSLDDLDDYDRALSMKLWDIQSRPGVYLLPLEDLVTSASAAFTEASGKAAEALSTIGLGVNEAAIAYNAGLLDLTAYSVAYPELTERILETAEAMKNAEESTDETAESMLAAASATRQWRDALREQNAEMLEAAGAHREAYDLKMQMLSDEQAMALRELAVDSQIIQSGESVTDLSIEELRKRLSANEETNAEMLAQDQFYANERVRLWEDMWNKTNSGNEPEDTEDKSTSNSYEAMLQRQQAALENAAAAEMERNGQYEEALRIRKQLIEEERSLAITAAEERIEAGISSAEEISSINAYYDQEIISAEEESARRQIEAEKQKTEEIKALNKEMFSSILSFASSFSSAIGDVYSAITERRLQQIDDETDATLEALGLQEDTELEKLQKEYTEAVKNGDMELAQEKEREIQRTQIEEEAEERKRKLQREEAERSKALAIFQATIDTLASVVGFMSDPGGWAGIAMSAMAAATGAAQIAAIAAEPLPSYAVGAVDINEDQIAQLHQGELVVPKTFAEGIRDGDISIGGSESKVEVTIINNTGAVATAERVDNGDITQLKITIGETIASEIAKGRLDSAMTRRFNITRRNQRG